MEFLKLSIPGSQDTLSRRQDVHVDILSVKDWHRAMCAEPQARTPHVFSGKPEPMSKSNFGMATLPASNSTSEQRRLLMRVDENGEPDEFVIQNRIEALEILEGKRQSKPDRDYSGDYAEVFTHYAVLELHALRMKRNLERARARAHGWQCLHQTLVDGLYWEDVEELGRWNDQQRAYLLTLEDVGKFWGVRSIRNLDACSRPKLRELMEQIEKRGWRDVIWVTNGNEELPKRLEKDEMVRVIEWEQSTGKSATERACCPMQ
ncbi:Fc.00g021270.m01.CDS01 [Cosmosporella sp. VM-42]